jgi:hypothetical protein
LSNPNPLHEFTLADLIGLAAAAFFTVALFLNPDASLPARLALLLTGLAGMAYGWYRTRGKKGRIKLVGIPGLALLWLLVVGLVVELVAYGLQ